MGIFVIFYNPPTFFFLPGLFNRGVKYGLVIEVVSLPKLDYLVFNLLLIRVRIFPLD